MKIEFFGGAGSVTGSSYLITSGGRKVLLDCGLYQGADARKRDNEVFPFDPKRVDFLVLSHAHIDHSGRIPLLYKKGFRGRIITTPPSFELCDIMLRDSAFIQEQDAERENRRRERRRKAPEIPIYTVEDAVASLTLFETLDYDQEEVLFPGFRIRFQDSGHMLGSAFVEMWITTDEGEELKIVYSGDIGNHNIPLMKEPHYVEEADIVIMESTYGDRLHEPQSDENRKLVELINNTTRNGGNVVIPSFAVGRTQEIIYVLNEAAEAHELDPSIRVYVDSPLASKATEVFTRNARYFDPEAQEKMAAGDNVLNFPQLHFTESVEESRNLNNTKSGLVILSASGMAEAGRIRHHLKHNLWRPESSVVFVGYQAPQTLGDIILSGEDTVRIFGEEIAVQARICRMHGLSGHADKNGLIGFARAFTRRPPKKVFLVHGEPEAQHSLGTALQELGFSVDIPREGTVVEIRSLKDLEAPTRTTVIPLDQIAGRKSSLKDTLQQEISSMDLSSLSNEAILERLRKVLADHR